MGQTQSNVPDAVKAQAGSQVQKVYTLTSMKGDGVLVDLMKQATTTKNYAAMDEAIKTKVEPFLYNKGEGKLFHITEIVLMRNRFRSKNQQLLKSEADYDNWKPPDDDKDPKMYKRVCWKMDERGALGETALHICLLKTSSVHTELAKRLVKFYPALIDDVYMSDEYYGENVLHMAIANEDFQMVKFLVENNINVMERATGAFFGPEDQKWNRRDNLKHEEVDRNLNTNYDGYVYWGEYCHCFAACLSQEECYRLIMSKGSNPNAVDSNGNMVLHIMVIHNNKAMFNMAYELGAELGIRNKLNLTPLTLAAKIAKKELFFHALSLEREIYWQIGSVTCAAYPLKQFDTIDPVTGGIQKDSALNLIVFGDKTQHLDLLEGPVMDLLHAKWNTFVKFRFYRNFFLFAVYFFITTMAFVNRPLHKMKESFITEKNATILFKNISYISSQKELNMKTLSALGSEPLIYEVENIPSFHTFPIVSKEQNVSFDMDLDSSGSETSISILNGTTIAKDTIKKGLWFTEGHCLDQPKDIKEWTRLTCECLMFIGAVSFLLGALRECRFLGAKMFFQNLSTAPSRVLFLISCHLVILLAILRISCCHEAEDLVAVCIMMTTSPYFLFFCRGFKTVGPFVVMIYRILSGDLLRFILIYLIFVMGFSQAYYLIFLSYKNPEENNPLGNPAESIVAMFMMSLSSFEELYKSFKSTDHDGIAKILFAIYMAIVAILLINMLIAMMGNTYTKIAETANEWQRQWARIVLVVERGVSPSSRHKNQGLYSQPMSDGTRALVLRLSQSEDEKQEMKDLLDLRRYHDKAVARRLNKAVENPKPVHRHSIAPSLLSVKTL